MITVNFIDETNYTVYGELWQWDRNQILRIQGLNLNTAEEIHFSMQPKSGEAVRCIGITKYGVTDVMIPGEMLENAGKSDDYYIYAFVYVAEGEAAETTQKIELKVKARPKPEPFEELDGGELFGAVVAAVNAAADRAENAASPENIANIVRGYLAENPVNVKRTLWQGDKLFAGYNDEKIEIYGFIYDPDKTIMIEMYSCNTNGNFEGEGQSSEVHIISLRSYGGNMIGSAYISTHSAGIIGMVKISAEYSDGILKIGCLDWDTESWEYYEHHITRVVEF